jgi:hypothetical protein
MDRALCDEITRVEIPHNPTLEQLLEVREELIYFIEKVSESVQPEDEAIKSSALVSALRRLIDVALMLHEMTREAN